MKVTKEICMLVLFILSVVACNSDDFYETTRIISTDKKEYEVNDDIIISMTIKPIKSAKDIRFYENYKNIEFSFSIINEYMDIYNGYWTHKSSVNVAKTKNILTTTITPQNPFEVSFTGKISLENQKVTLNFPEINYKASFDKELFKNGSTYVRIHGQCFPINPKFADAREDYFESVDIKINL